MKPTNLFTSVSKPLAYCFTIAILVTAVYSNTIDSPFIFDDLLFIKNNPIVTNGIVSESVITPEMPDGVTNTRHTRFIGYMSFHLNYLLGGFKPRGYHFANILIHVANSILIFALGLLVMQSPAMRNVDTRGFKYELALCSALLFGLHPLQTQAVTYLSQRFTSLAALFSLLCVLFYFIYKLRERSLFLALAAIASVLAMHSKENAFVMPAGIVMIELFLFEGKRSRRVITLMPLLLTMVIVPAYKLLDAGPTLAEATGVPESIDRLDYFITSIAVVATYLRLLVFPINQNFDYDYPLYNSIATPQVAIALLLHIVILLSGARLFKKDGAGRAAALAIAWFYLMISVENGLIPLANVIFEHRVYLPSVFIFIAIPHMAMQFTCKAKGAIALLVAAAICLGFLAYTRNNVWGSAIVFWSDITIKSPDKARGFNNLCSAYNDAGEFRNAETFCNRALELDPSMTATHLNLAEIYEKTGRYAEAVQELELVLAAWPDTYQVNFRLGAIYGLFNMHKQAAIAYVNAIRFKPDFHEAHFNLGNAFASLGMYKDAEDAFSRALELDPSNMRYAHNLNAIREMARAPK